MEEVCIVGGGIMGLSAAYALQRRGLQVHIVERAPRLGAAATHVSAGILAPISQGDVSESPIATFGLDSLERFSPFVLDLEARSGMWCNLRDEGILWIAFSAEQAQALQRLRQAWMRRGHQPRFLTASEVMAREPHLSSRVHSGLWVDEDKQVDPRLLVAALVSTLQQDGAHISCGCHVREIVIENEQVAGLELEHADGSAVFVPARRVVLAAGAWSSQGLSSPLRDSAVRPVKGQLVRLRGPTILKHVIRTPEVYLIPRVDGELLVGATVEEGGFSATPTAGAILHLLRAGAQALPGLADMEFVESSVGVRPAVADGMPLIGPTDTQGLYVCTAHFRDGILLAPASAHYLAEAIVNDCVPEPIAAFSPQRLLERAERRDSHTGSTGLEPAFV